VHHARDDLRTIRSGDPSRQASGLREPVKAVHNDYTDWSGAQRVRDILPDEAAALLARRVAIIQLWRGTRGPIEREPLAICDALHAAWRPRT
jgi:hypothetical protein